MALPWLDAHRGPFLFCIDRPNEKKPGFHTSEWLAGEVERAEVEEQAQALLTDPRDTIAGVSVWSLKDECFVGGFRK